jgi:hypothetical protein
VSHIKLIDLHLRYIDEMFDLKITNTSQIPIRIWSTRYSLGYDSFHFKLSPLEGNPILIRRKPRIWTVNPPDFITIQPNSISTQKLDLNDGTWEVEKLQIEPQREMIISVILEIRADEDTRKYGIITGNYESNRLQFKSIGEIIY